MKIAFLGDIAIFEDGLLATDYKEGLSEVRNILASCDLVIANLETPITEEKESNVCKGMHLKSSIETINVLKFLNVAIVSLANNHICDFGLKGMQDTIRYLNINNIKHFGVNGEHLYLEYNNNKLSLRGYCCYSSNGAFYINRINKNGVNALVKKQIKRDLKEDTSKGFFPIISLHWGDEYSSYPNELQVDFFHDLTYNSDLIIHGHHAHVLQGIEKFNKSLAAYNLGNFCFDESQSPINKKLKIKQSELNKESIVLIVTINDCAIISFDTIGVYYNNNVVRIIDNKDKVQQLSKEIVNCRQKDYKILVQKNIRSQKSLNLQKHNLKWLISKINYYSVGAKIKSCINAC